MSEEGKTLRRNILGLWSNGSHLNVDTVTGHTYVSELDRFMIALHRFQTEGKVEYGQLMGVHGGGWGTKDDQVNTIMYNKATLDANQALPLLNVEKTTNPVNQMAHQDSHPDKVHDSNNVWPSPMPNLAPERIKFVQTPPDPKTETWHMAHQFCWHADSPFYVWHRPYCMMYERGLQKYDPRNGG